MTDQTQVSQVQEQKPSDKEMNFRALEQKYQRQLEQERAGRLEAERQNQELISRKQEVIEEDDISEPYVDHKRLARKFSNFEKDMDKKIEQKAEEKARQMVERERQESWMRTNSDFYDVMQNAQKLYETDQELAETILAMPESFERQKLVYKNIKALGLHKPAVKQASIQEKIDSNKRSPYYQPSGVASAPYSNGGDFSEAGQKNAYQKMQELKKQLRI